MKKEKEDKSNNKIASIIRFFTPKNKDREPSPSKTRKQPPTSAEPRSPPFQNSSSDSPSSSATTTTSSSSSSPSSSSQQTRPKSTPPLTLPPVISVVPAQQSPKDKQPSPRPTGATEPHPPSPKEKQPSPRTTEPAQPSTQAHPPSSVEPSQPPSPHPAEPSQQQPPSPRPSVEPSQQPPSPRPSVESQQKSPRPTSQDHAGYTVMHDPEHTTTTTTTTTTPSSPTIDSPESEQLSTSRRPLSIPGVKVDVNNNTNNNNNINSSTDSPVPIASSRRKTGNFNPLPYQEPIEFKADNVGSTKTRSTGPPEILPEEIDYNLKEDYLGHGSFGAVYKGRCRGQEVAVKVPIKQKLSLGELTSFRNEVKIMSKIFHPNVVLFLGACTQMEKMQIVTERCETDLERLLANRQKQLSITKRMQMAKDAALGMNWLHGITRIVHNDLKSANLLVDSNLRVKVTDFGFSQIKEGDHFVDKNTKGTPLWMAPEVMQGQPYNDKADVYSFGIILWEIATREKPYEHHKDYHIFRKSVCDGERPKIPEDLMPPIKNLMQQCWAHDPTTRPSFNQIVFRLNEILIHCVIEDEAARDIWKNYFLAPKQDLIDQVPWNEFESVLRDELEQEDQNIDFTDVKSLLSAPKDAMGKIREVVTMERFDKMVKWFGPFFDEQKGPSIISQISMLSSQPWFHGDIDREEAMGRLTGQPDGTFMIRLSSTDPKTAPFTLSLPGNQHRRIKRLEEEKDGEMVTIGYRILAKQHTYPTLVDLATNCVDYKLTTACPKVNTNQYIDLYTANNE
eukprot:TRINITY_DN2393_c0_g1_i1.p1 TRINITY_DN2393_c0_g1~~TRINITY_DN2393_c0_g1_i1.p1  ORF type:complete len:789 (-),score=300.64 TRINITY_DN2393_c0_g1_i1:65-2431(-)